jgi:hypothetical protein
VVPLPVTVLLSAAEPVELLLHPPTAAIRAMPPRIFRLIRMWFPRTMNHGPVTEG